MLDIPNILGMVPRVFPWACWDGHMAGCWPLVFLFACWEAWVVVLWPIAWAWALGFDTYVLFVIEYGPHEDASKNNSRW